MDYICVDLSEEQVDIIVRELSTKLADDPDRREIENVIVALGRGDIL